MKLNIKVIPRASKNELSGPDANGAYKARLTAAPVDNEANKKLLALLSKKFDAPKSRITIVRGEKSRNKIIEIN